MLSEKFDQPTGSNETTTTRKNTLDSILRIVVRLEDSVLPALKSGDHAISRFGGKANFAEAPTMRVWRAGSGEASSI